MLWETVFRCPCYDCACGKVCKDTCPDRYHAHCCERDCKKYSRKAQLVREYLRYHPFWDEMRQKLSDCPFVNLLDEFIMCLNNYDWGNFRWRSICNMCSQMSAKDDYTIVDGAIRELFAICELPISKDTCRWFLRNIFSRDCGVPNVTIIIQDYLRNIMMSTTSYKVTTPILQDFQSILNLTSVDTHNLKFEVSCIARKMRKDLERSCYELECKKRVKTFNKNFKTLADDIYNLTSDALIVPDSSGTIRARMIKLLEGQLNRLNPAAETLQNRSELPT